MRIGIDALSFYTSCYTLDFQEFAKGTNQDVAKFHEGLAQLKMGLSPPDEDAITLGANAASQLLDRIPTEGIDTLIYATETGVDYSKARGHLHPSFAEPAQSLRCYRSEASLLQLHCGSSNGCGACQPKTRA